MSAAESYDVQTHDRAQALIRDWFSQKEAESGATIKARFKLTAPNPLDTSRPDDVAPVELSRRCRVALEVGTNKTVFHYELPESAEALERLCLASLEPFEAWKVTEATRWREKGF